MCGIVGYIGPKKVVPVVIGRLAQTRIPRLRLRRNAVVNDGSWKSARSGKLRNLEETLKKSPMKALYGIGHTRWRLMGVPPKRMLIPIGLHRADCGGAQRIIENYLS